VLQHKPLYLLLAATLSLGVFLMVAGPSLRRSRVDVATRLRRLDPDVWRLELAQSLQSRSFEGGLRPILRDAGRLWERLLQALHLEGPSSLQRRLQVAAPGESVTSFYVEKLKLAFLLVALLLVVNFFVDLADVVQGPLPPLLWLAMAVLGFVLPDLALADRLRRRRNQILSELPILADLLSAATSAGYVVQQSVVEVNGCLNGELAREWQHLCDLLEQQHLGLPEALGQLKHRNAVAELDMLADQLIAGHVRGQALGEPLAAFSMSLRTRYQQDVIAAGGRATERMALPVWVFIFIPLVALVVVPTLVTLVHLAA
jgi:Flp pilus assembly protein TadB